jgi:hypothetical protein
MARPFTSVVAAEGARIAAFEVAMVSATASLYNMIAWSDCARDEMRGDLGAGLEATECRA